MSDAYDFSYLLRHDLVALFFIWFPLVRLTDSMNFFNLFIPTSTVWMEKRLMIYIAALRPAFDRRDTTDVAGIRSGHNIADSLTNPCV